MAKATIPLNDSETLLSIFGTRDRNVRMIRDTLGVDITHQGGEILISGEDQAVAQATEAVEQLKAKAGRRGILPTDEVAGALARVADAPDENHPIDIVHAGRRVVPRTPGQAQYVDAIRTNDLIFSIGPAGTGKTYLAVALAVEALKNDLIRKIVLVRPAVEAGEKLGYLPGDMQAKINPYLRPLLDALHDMMDYEQIKRLSEMDVIEVIPLAYMRGRTLNEAFIILDEAQNTTVAQMKMFLTRMGIGSKIVVSGDETQVDLPKGTTSGLTDAVRRLEGIEGFAKVRMGEADIVRHRLVQEIVRAYEGVPAVKRSPPVVSFPGPETEGEGLK